MIAAVIAIAGALLRQTGVPTYRTIWAEDGAVLAQCAYTGPSLLACLSTPYDGWALVLPRLLAAVATALPPARLSYALASLAALSAGVCAFLVARAVRDVTRSSVAGLMAGASLLLIAPAVREVGGNLTNLHWIMFVAATTVLVSTWIGHRFDLADGLLVGLVAFSSPFGPILLVFAVITFLLGDRRLGPLIGVIGAGVAVVLWFSVTTPRAATSDLPVTLLSPIQWYLESIVLGSSVGGRGPVQQGLVTAALVVVLAGLLWRLVVDRRAAAERPAAPEGPAGPRWWRTRPFLDLFAVVALLAAGAAVFAASTYLNKHVAPRYLYVPIALSIVALFMGLGLLVRDPAAGRLATRSTTWRPRPGWVALAAVALVLAIEFTISFRAWNRASRGPNVPRQMPAAGALCSTGAPSATIDISPFPASSVWQVVIPCDRF